MDDFGRFSILFLLFFLTIIGATLYLDSPTEYNVEINYTIVYPDTTITKDSVFSVYSHHLVSDVYTSSNRGTNCIQIGDCSVEHTTCPIRINHYKFLKHWVRKYVPKKQ